MKRARLWSRRRSSRRDIRAGRSTLFSIDVTSAFRSAPGRKDGSFAASLSKEVPESWLLVASHPMLFAHNPNASGALASGPSRPASARRAPSR
jgi:hypothetical protein